MAVLFLLLLLIGEETPPEPIDTDLIAFNWHLDSKEGAVGRFWTPERRKQAYSALSSVNKTTGVSIRTLIAIIERESEWKPWAVSKINSNGTKDYGLTQQNEVYYKDRCLSIGKHCRLPDLYDPVLSIKLMSVHLKWCKGSIGCYNHPQLNKLNGNPAYVLAVSFIEQGLKP